MEENRRFLTKFATEKLLNRDGKAPTNNQDIKKIEEQIAQSRRKKKGEDVEPEPTPDESNADNDAVETGGQNGDGTTAGEGVTPVVKE